MIQLIILMVIIIVALSIITKARTASKTNKKISTFNGSTPSSVNKEEELNHRRQDNKGEMRFAPNYWQKFKKQRPMDAIEIERVVNRQMDSIPDKDAFEIVSSLYRWSKNTAVPIRDLKKWFLEGFEIQVRDVGLELALSGLRLKKKEEAQKMNISQENTICAFMESFIEESNFMTNHANSDFQLRQRQKYDFDDSKKKKKEFKDMVTNLLKAFVPNDEPDKHIDKNVAHVISPNFRRNCAYINNNGKISKINVH